MPTRRAILYRCEHNLNIEYTSRKVLTWTTYGNYARVVAVSEIERESEGAASCKRLKKAGFLARNPHTSVAFDWTYHHDCSRF